MKQEALKMELSEKELEGIIGGGRASDFLTGFKEPFTGKLNDGYRFNFAADLDNSWRNAGAITAGAVAIAGIAAVAIGLYEAIPYACKKGKELLGW